jgi:hypothetical protein
MSNKTYKLSKTYNLDNVGHPGGAEASDHKYAFLKIYRTDTDNISSASGLAPILHQFQAGIYISKTNIQIASLDDFHKIEFEDLR